MDIDIILIDNIEDNKIEDIIDDNIIFDEEINKEDIDIDNKEEELEFDIILENPDDNLNIN